MLVLLASVGCQRTISETQARELLNKDIAYKREEKIPQPAGNCSWNSGERCVPNEHLCDREPGRVEFLSQTPDAADARVYPIVTNVSEHGKEWAECTAYAIAPYETVHFTHADDGWHIHSAEAGGAIH
jgi:hypothetical protein